MSYTVSAASLQIRKKNIRWGLIFSLVLIATVSIGHMLYPETYNEMLFWSVLILVVIGNVINYYRYRRYLRLIKDHRIEIEGKKVLFYTGNEKSVLDAMDIAMLTFYRKKGNVDHIQVKLRNNRGIRLEGYADLEQLGQDIADLIPEHAVNGRQP